MGADVRALDDRPGVLYVSYDGALEALGQSQVLAYLLRLAPHYRICLLSFEKPADHADRARVDDLRTRLEQAGIAWNPLRYHQWPPVVSTAFDVARGIAVGFRQSTRTPIRIVHARGYVAALIALAVARARKAAFLFDMRGFWADEKVDAGHWPRGSALYRIVKRFEKRFFERADAVVSLTHAGVDAIRELGYRLQPDASVTVIPTCTDTDAFAPAPRDAQLAERLGLAADPVLGCVGTLTNWYLREPMLDYVAYLQQQMPRLRTLFVTADDSAAVRRDAASRGVDPDRIVVVRAPFSDMPRYMGLIDVGMFFIKPVFSKKGSAATKLGEFLASGIPVVINDGVGDSGCIIRSRGAGVVLPKATSEHFAATLGEVQRLFGDETVRRRCRDTALALFDVNIGAASYRQIYDRLAARRTGAPARSRI